MGQGSPDTWVHTETGIRAENGDLVCDAPDPYDCTHLECNVGKPKVIVLLPAVHHAAEVLRVVTELGQRWHRAQGNVAAMFTEGTRFTQGRCAGYEQGIALLLGTTVREVRIALLRGEL